MTSHLSISYTTTAPLASAGVASAVAAAGSPVAAAGSSAPAGTPLGLLGALFDQLLAGAAAADSAATTAPPATPAPVATPLGVSLPLAAPTPPSQGLTLLDTLTDELGDLQDQLDGGVDPDPDKLQALSDTIDALTILLSATPPAAPSDSAAAPAAPPSTKLTNVSPAAAAATAALALPASIPALPSASKSAADALSSLASLAATLPQAPRPTQTAALPADQAAALLKSLGLTATASSSTDPLAALASRPTGTVVPPLSSSPATTSAPAAPYQPNPVAALTQKLADLSVALTPADPVVARKLETLSITVASVKSAPDLLARLDPSTPPSATPTAPAAAGTTLNSIVARLDQQRPAPQQQIAAPSLSPPTALAPALAAGPLRQRLDAARSASAATTSTSPASPPPDASAKLTALATLAPAQSPGDTAPKAQPRTAAPEGDTPSPRTETAQTQPQASAPVANPTAPTTHPNARILPAAYQPVSNPINMGQVAFEMVRQVHQGLSRFAIRLDPAELGRVDVRMNVDPSGGVTAKLTVDRPETLDLFQRDQRTLERALQQAGLDSSRTTLEFSLRQNQNPFAGMSGGDQRQPGTGHATNARYKPGDDEDVAPLAAITLYRGAASAGGVNLFV